MTVAQPDNANPNKVIATSVCSFIDFPPEISPKTVVYLRGVNPTTLD